MSSHPPDPPHLGLESDQTKIARLQEQLNNRDSLVAQKIRELDRISRELAGQKKENKRITAEIIELKVTLAKKETELEHKKPRLRNRVLAVCITLFFGVSTILFNLANSLLTNKPPETGPGAIILDAAIVIYAICAIVTVFMLGGS